MSTVVSIFGGAVLALLLAGYLGQKFLPPPKPKVVGIDLGTTYSCIGVYHAVTGNVSVIKDSEGHSCIPSTVTFRNNVTLVGYDAARYAHHDPRNTLFDAKRFIGKQFTREELKKEAHRYEFKVVSTRDGMAIFFIGDDKNITKITPDFVGSRILTTLKQTAERNLTGPVKKCVMSVPAEFDERQRNHTKMAAAMAGIEVLRIINEPTAAALAYGLHKKDGVQNVLVVDLGGGTLDVSLLNIQGGMFSTQAMAGNNHLGGQDFNERTVQYLLKEISHKYGRNLEDIEDIFRLHEQVEQAKLILTSSKSAVINLQLHSFLDSNNNAIPSFVRTLQRDEFEDINHNLFKKILEPIQKVLEVVEASPSEIDEIVLVGGSTRIPKVRQMMREFFNKEPNVSIDPDLAVTYGVSIQAGILGGMWPLTVSAIELPSRARKIHL
ncbi:unnamed protein product [Owenia fusiformis]|uniref:Heat shock 70 kDa protein 13 n=1 Tax=Owenia fusiformis TaxID=6347 RepID=A0A8J1XUE6_OWEFU|nr:unnamed protein product [Owenia fusiformis]